MPFLRPGVIKQHKPNPHNNEVASMEKRSTSRGCICIYKKNYMTYGIQGSVNFRGLQQSIAVEC